MKKIITIILLLLPALTLRADGRSEEILRKMEAAFASYDSYRIDFTADMKGEFDALPGTLIVSGEKYYLGVYDSEIFFDGKHGYTYSESNDEVIIETPDPNDTGLFANPARIFRVYRQDYAASDKGNATVNGKNAAVIELKPRALGTGYSAVTVYADPATGMPVRMVYRLEGYANDLVLNVVKISPNVQASPETFIFDPTRYPGVEIIDFR